MAEILVLYYSRNGATEALAREVCKGVDSVDVVAVLVEVGQTVAKDDPLIEVETDKAAVTIPSPRGGRVVNLTGGVENPLLYVYVIHVIIAALLFKGREIFTIAWLACQRRRADYRAKMYFSRWKTSLRRTGRIHCVQVG